MPPSPKWRCMEKARLLAPASSRAQNAYIEQASLGCAVDPNPSAARAVVWWPAAALGASRGAQTATQAPRFLARGSAVLGRRLPWLAHSGIQSIAMRVSIYASATLCYFQDALLFPG